MENEEEIMAELLMQVQRCEFRDGEFDCNEVKKWKAREEN